jgi:transcriptional regulator with XRE-family HTH domain
MADKIYRTIKSIRELKNYTQEYMAFELKISQAAYYKIESGRTLLTYKKLENIAKIFKISIEDIINFNSDAYIGTAKENSSETHHHLYKNSLNDLSRLYEDKIELLERLLLKTEKELEFYKKKHVEIFFSEKTAITYT